MKGLAGVLQLHTKHGRDRLGEGRDTTLRAGGKASRLELLQDRTGATSPYKALDITEIQQVNKLDVATIDQMITGNDPDSLLRIVNLDHYL